MSGDFIDPNGRVYSAQRIIMHRPDEPLPTSIRTAQHLDRWRGELGAAEVQVENLVSERRRVLTSATIEALRGLDDRIATARLRAERATAIIVEAEERFAQDAAERAAGEPARRAAYVEACAARDEYERLHRKVYAPAAQKIGEMLPRTVELAAIIERANHDLPDGAERIDPEAFRDLGGGYDHRLTSRVNLPGVNGSDAPFWRG